MKIAALGDIHGNYQALAAVLDDIDRWQPDLVLVLGDIINRGPRSRECLHLILKKLHDPDWKIIRGNHEGYVMRFDDPNYFRSGPDFELRKVIYWTYQSLSGEDMKAVNDLPVEITFRVDEGSLIHCLHASRLGDRIGIYPDTPEDELFKLANPRADLFLVGHTHQPFIKRWEKSLLINIGSVGLPFDGETRPSYARIIKDSEGWRGKIIRLDYDQQAAEDDFLSTGFVPEGGELAELILAELQLGWPQLSKFFKRFETPIREGKISMREAVKEHMLEPNIEYKTPITLGDEWT